MSGLSLGPILAVPFLSLLLRNNVIPSTGLLSCSKRDLYVQLHRDIATTTLLPFYFFFQPKVSVITAL